MVRSRRSARDCGSHNREFCIIFSRGDNQRFPEIKIYRRFLYGILAYYITDALWGFLDSLQLYSLLYLDTVIYYVAMAVGVLFWTQYVVIYLGGDNTFSRFLTIAGRFCFAAVITITVINKIVRFCKWASRECRFYQGIFINQYRY